MNLTKGIFLLFTLLICFSCSDQKNKNETVFSLLSPKQTGVDFRNVLTDDPLDPNRNVMDFYNYYHGGGVAVGDFNNDGLEDLVFSGNEVLNKLYINEGGLKFKDVTKKSNINQHKRWTTGVVVVDINNDGFDDIYFSQSGPFNTPAPDRRNTLFINNKDLSFSEKAVEYGLADTNLSEQAVFFDYDKDGDQDCFVLNTSVYVRIGLSTVFEHLENKDNLRAASSNLYRNDGGKFTKVTEEAGMLKYGFGLSVVVSDINNDGWLDVYQSNDYSVPDFMYINQGDGTFVDEVKSRTKNLSWFSMGCDIADWNNDGYVDIGVVDMAATDHVRGKTLMAPMDPELFKFTVDIGYQRQHMFNAMQLNNGDGTFNNVAGMTGLLASEWSWAALFADFDNDGWKDYFISNGFRRYARDNDSRIRVDKARKANGGTVPKSLRKDLYAQIPEVKIPNYIYQNKADLKFVEVGKDWGMGQADYSSGAAYADLDNDGDLELIVNTVDDFVKIYKNNSNGNYLDIELESDRPLQGTRISIYHGDEMQFQEYGTVRGYQSSVSPKIHFGLGNIETIDRIVVEWNSGKTSILTDVESNQLMRINSSSAGMLKKNDSAKKQLFEERSIDFVHQENIYNDYELEVLLPYAQSGLGPNIGVGDANGDGLEDFYIGGAKNQSGQLMIQQNNGSFQSLSSDFDKHRKMEDMGSHFFDADGDGDLDLYVISSGNDVDIANGDLNDRLYVNQGNARFKYQANSLPLISGGGSKVRSIDFDSDGDLDLFVAGRLEPKAYPNPTRSYLLRNNKGKFEDVTSLYSEALLKPGMVNDFLWTDINADEKPDLILVGEWMPITVFLNEGSKFTDASEDYFPEKWSGWNFSISEADIDGDGDNDFVVGNLGLNSKFKASKKKPLILYANDFDNNGTCDVVLAKDYKGKTVPVRGRECSSQQMPFILEKFESYGEFANASIEDILGEEMLNEGLKLSVNSFETGIYMREGDQFIFKALPRVAQKSVTTGILINDFNQDNRLDILLGGNIYNMEIETTPLDAGEGLVLLQSEDGAFNAMTTSRSGFRIPGDVKDIQDITLANGNMGILVANNNNAMQLFQFLGS